MPGLRQLFWSVILPTQLEPEFVIANAEQIYQQLRTALAGYLQTHARSAPLFIGIRTGGHALAQRLHEELRIAEPIGALNIAFYRDDFATTGLSTERGVSQLPIDINARHVVLIDDILYTGRTIRAAMNELFDFGRPGSITLACLIARNGRELPIQADVVGARVQLESKQVMKLRSVQPMQLALEHRR